MADWTRAGYAVRVDYDRIRARRPSAALRPGENPRYADPCESEALADV